MAKFKFAYDLNGNFTDNIRPFYIAGTTVIEHGEVVKHTPATGIEAVASDFDDPALGVAVEDHDGSTAGRQSGNELKVSCSPSAVYSLKTTNALTLTGGSTTTAVIATLVPQTDDIFIGGYVEILTCAASADMVGKLIPITDSTGSSGTLTFATQAAAMASGDTIRLYPGKRAIGTAWDLTSDGNDINYLSKTTGASGMKLVDADPKNKKAYFKLDLHQFSASAFAI